MELTPVSEIFLVTFSILYGIMLNACLGLGLFHFGRVRKCSKALRRLVVSLIFINFLPIVLFSKVLTELQGIEAFDCLTVFGVFLLSMIVFGFYRLIHLFITWNCGWFYDLDEKYCYSDNMKKRVEFVASSSKKWQLVGFGFYVILFIIGWLILFNTSIPCPKYAIVTSRMYSLILTVTGIFFEVLSFLYMAEGKVFFFKSKKERKGEYLKRYTTIDDGLEKIRNKWFKSLMLFLIGVILQGIALFL